MVLGSDKRLLDNDAIPGDTGREIPPAIPPQGLAPANRGIPMISIQNRRHFLKHLAGLSAMAIPGTFHCRMAPSAY